MNKKASELKKGDKVKMAGKVVVVEEIEFSEIGKQGSKKVRIVASDENSVKSVIVRPEDYPFEVI